MVLQIINSEYEILEILFDFKKDFYNQELNDDTVKFLASKFAKYATFVKILENDRALGFVAYYSNNTETKTAFLSMIVVSTEFQGLGIGTKLLNYIQEDCKNAGMNYLRLEVDGSNTNAISFYKKNCFIEESKNDKSIIMIKKL